LRRVAVPVLVLLLLLGATAAFAVSEALKQERSPVHQPRFSRVFSPTCGCATNAAELSVRLRKRETVDALIVDEDGNDVRTLATRARRGPGRISFRWDGRDDAGRVVPDGMYRLRMDFDGGSRTIVIPKVVRVDTKAPAIALLSVTPAEFHSARIVFRTSERAQPLLLADGAVVARGKIRRAGRKALVWQAPRAGRYVLSLEAQDAAGNVSAPTEGSEIVLN
jgi:FlgD Ig-like domain